MPTWDTEGLLPKNEDARTARYRRLQSWYREVVMEASAGDYREYKPLGSYLDPSEVERDRSLNFIHPEAHAHAEQRAVEVQAEGGTLSVPRLFHNMLSSMPMCFNLFGAMRAEPEFLEVFRSLFDSEATAIREIVCEWAPPEPALRLGDHSAFDAVVHYEADGERRFVGIETKYTEPFSRKDYDRPRYREVTSESGWFASAESADRLKASATNQLWRTTLLAAAADGSAEYGRGSVAVVALSDDRSAGRTVDAVRAELSTSHADRLAFVAIESILDAADGIESLAEWSRTFRCRYVDHQRPDEWANRQNPPAGD